MAYFAAKDVNSSVKFLISFGNRDSALHNLTYTFQNPVKTDLSICANLQHGSRIKVVALGKGAPIIMSVFLT